MPSLGRFHYLEAQPPDPSRPLHPGGAPRDVMGTLVLIHGFPLSARMWEPQLELASEGWRVIAPHLRGFGGAPPSPVAMSMDEYAADIVDLLDQLHVDRPVIAGLSMGGYIAFALLRR